MFERHANGPPSGPDLPYHAALWPAPSVFKNTSEPSQGILQQVVSNCYNNAGVYGIYKSPWWTHENISLHDSRSRRYATQLWRDLMEHCEPFSTNCWFIALKPRGIPAWLRKASNKTASDRIGHLSENDWDNGRHFLQYCNRDV